MQKGDVVFARRTTRSREGQKGDKPYGVMALWEYNGKSKVKSDDLLPWTGGDYKWVLYLREIKTLDQPYQENFNRLPFVSQALQSDIIGLRPEYARGYFEELLDQEFISEGESRFIQGYFETVKSSATDTNHSPHSISTAREKRYTSTVDRRLRDHRLVEEIKERYSNKCQICRDHRLKDRNVGYSEVHHIQPLGRPHLGADVKKNMIVLCPNHHSDFDNGVVSIDPDSREINHLYENAVDGQVLHSHRSHTIAKEYLRYHINEISVL